MVLAKRLKSVVDRAKQLNDKVRVVGIPNPKKSRDESNNITNFKSSMILEFGSPVHNIPEMSFIRPTVSEEFKHLGVTSLNSATNQTPKAVKAAYDLANEALSKSGGTITGDTNFTDNL